MNKFDEGKEYLKCKLSPLYFIENYIKIPVAGGFVTLKDNAQWNSTIKYKDLILLLTSKEIDNVIHMASRQHGKTTNIAMICLHHLMFYPNFKMQFLTLTKDNAFDVVERIKFMHSYLPNFLKFKMKDRGGKKTYVEFENGSRFTSKYISGNIDPESIGRGFSTPFIWIDEASFIPHMEIAWGAMQPALSAARVHAKRNNYPTKIIMTSTPNGAGDNFFYKVWLNSWEYSELLDQELLLQNKRKISKKAQNILNKDPEKNNFAKVRIHWSETGKTKEWYEQQVKELNFNMRQVNQEINLVFLGSAYTIVDDEVLAHFEVSSPVSELDIGYGNNFLLYKNIDEYLTSNKDEIFILGVDTALSTAARADFSAMTLTVGSTGECIGEWHGKISVLKRYAVLLKKLIKTLVSVYKLDEDSLKVIIERNSMGIGLVEDLIYDDTYDYNSFLFKTEIRKGERAAGLMTNASTREKMFELFLSIINENPKVIIPPILQEETRNLEQKSNGRIEAGKGAHDDIVMAYNFTLYIRYLLIKNGFLNIENGVQRVNSKAVINDIDVVFSSVSYENNYIKALEEADNEFGTQIIDDDPKLIKKRKKELLKQMNYNLSNDDDLGYDILM